MANELPYGKISNGMTVYVGIFVILNDICIEANRQMTESKSIMILMNMSYDAKF